MSSFQDLWDLVHNNHEIEASSGHAKLNYKTERESMPKGHSEPLNFEKTISSVLSALLLIYALKGVTGNVWWLN